MGLINTTIKEMQNSMYQLQMNSRENYNTVQDGGQGDCGNECISI